MTNSLKRRLCCDDVLVGVEVLPAEVVTYGYVCRGVMACGVTCPFRKMLLSLVL